MSIADLRHKAVMETVAQIRRLEAACMETDSGLNRQALENMKNLLLGLAAKQDLFPLQDFPVPEAGARRNSILYRLSEDDDHRYALYVNSARGDVDSPGVDSPAHFHTTWAIVAGICGREKNVFYRHTDDGGVEETGSYVVRAGTAVSLLPEDLHSIHIHEDTPTLNFHMYGLALEQLHQRQYYKPDSHEWVVFPAHTDIRDARG